MRKSTRVSVQKSNPVPLDFENTKSRKKSRSSCSEIKKDTAMDIEERDNNFSSATEDTSICNSDKQNTYPGFTIDLPLKLGSYEEFANIVEPVVQRINNSFAHNNNFALTTENEEQKVSNSKDTFDLRRALHFTGALLQNTLSISAKGRAISFELNEKNSKFPSSEEILNSLLSRLKKKSNSKQENLSLEFLLTYQEDFNPFSNLDEGSCLAGLVKIVKDYESLLNSNKGDHRANFFSKIQNRGELHEPEKPKKGAKKKGKADLIQSEEENDGSLMKAQILMNEVRNTIKSTFDLQSYKKQKLDLSSGGDVQICENIQQISERNIHPDEIKLRELLISEYNTPTSHGLQKALEFYLNGKSKCLKISLCTAMLLSLAYTNLAERVEIVQLDVLKNYLDLSKLIPFSTASALKLLQYRYFMAKALDTIMNVEVQNCLPRSAYFPALQEFDLETHHSNETSAILCERFLALYNSERIQVVTDISSKLSVYSQQLSLLNRIYGLLAPCADEADKENISPCKMKQQKSPMLGQMEKLIEDAANIPNMNDFPEYEHLLSVHLNKITGGLIIQKSSLETEWVSPKFGRSFEPSEKLNDTPDQKELFMVTKNLNLMQEERSSDFALKRSRNSIDNPPSFDNSEIADQNWTLNDISPSNNRLIEEEEEEKEEKMIVTSYSVCLEDKTMDIETQGIQEGFQVKEIELQPRKGDEIEEEHIPSPVTEKTDKTEGSQKVVELTEELNHGEITEKKDKKIFKIEKEIGKKLDCLKKKPTLDETEKKLNDLESTAPAFKKKKTQIEAQINKAKEWLSLYKQQIVIEKKGIYHTQKLLDKITDIEIQVPEMEHLLQMQKAFAFWRYKAESALKKLAKKQAAKKRKEGPENMDFNELADLIREAKELNILQDFDKLGYQEILSRWNELEGLKASFESGSNDLQSLKKIRKKLSSLMISDPDFEYSLNEKINLNELMIALLEETVSLDSILAFKETLKGETANLDPELYSQTIRKIEDAQRLQEVVKTFEPSPKVYQYDILRNIIQVLSEIENLKLDIPGANLLKNIAASFSWLLRLHQVIQKIQEFNGAATKGVDLDLSDERFEADKLIDFCGTSLTSSFNNANLTEEHKAELKKAFRDGETLTIPDERIQSLLNNLKVVIWRLEISNFSQEEKISEDFERYTHVPVEVVQELGPEATSELQAEAQKIKDWNLLYDEVFSSDIEDFLIHRVEANLDNSDLKNSLMSLRWKLQKLFTEYNVYFAKYPDFSNKIPPVRRFLGWIDWLLEAKTCINGLGARDENRLAILQKLYSEAPELEIPKVWENFKKIGELFTLADSALAEYKQRFQYAGLYEKWTQSKGSLRKESIHKIVEKNRVKPLLSEAKKLREILSEKLYYIDCGKEIADLDSKIKEYSNWKAKLETFSVNDGQRILRAATDSSIVVNDTDRIAFQLGQLHSEYSCLCLRDEQDEKLLLGLECQLRAYKLLKNISRNPTIDEWKKLLKYAEENPNTDPTSDKKLMRLLQAEIEELKFQHEIVKTLQAALVNGSVTDLNLDDLRKILNNFEKGSLKSEEDHKFMSELVQKIEKLINRGRELCSSRKKEPIIEFTSVLEQMKHLPIALTVEEKELEEVVRQMEYIVSTIRKHSVIGFREIEQILQEYKQCPALISEAEKLKEKYENSRKIYEDLKIQLNDVLQRKKQLGYDQLAELSEKLEEVSYDFERNLDMMKAELYALKIEYLQKISNSFETQKGKTKSPSKKKNSSFTISSEMIKLLAREGLELSETLRKIKKASTSLNQALISIDALLERVEEKIAQIDSESNLEILECMSPIMLGFIDFGQVIIERKVVLATSISQNQERNSLSKQIIMEEEIPSSHTDVFDNPSQPESLHHESQDQTSKNAIKGSTQLKKESLSKGKTSTSQGKESLTRVKEALPLQEKESVQKQPGQPNSHLKSDAVKSRLDKQVTSLNENLEKAKQKANDSQKSIESQPEKSKDPAKSSLGSKSTRPSNKNESKEIENSMSVMTVRDVLQSSKHLSLDLIESLKVAQRIVKGFPIIQNPAHLKKFEGLLQKVLEHPNICKSLVKKSFSSKYILELIKKSTKELLQLDEQLGNSSKEKDKENKNPTSSQIEIDSVPIAKKKIKNDLNSRSANLAEKSSNLNSVTQIRDATRDPRLKHRLKESEKSLLKNASSIAADSQNDSRSKLGLLLATNQPPSFASILQKQSSVSQEIAPESIEIEHQVFSDHSDKEDLPEKDRDLRPSEPIGFDFEELPHETTPLSNEIEISHLDSTHPINQCNDEKPRSVSKSRSVSIEYDPEDPDSSIPPSPIKGNENTPMPNKNTILKLFEGALKGVDNELIPGLGLYTCDPVQKIRCLPRLPSDSDNTLKMQARMSVAKFEPYFNQFLSTFNENKNYIISGWVESENAACQDICNSMAFNFLAEDKIGIMKYYECTKLYFLHEKQFRPEWVRWLKFKKKKLQQDSCPSLYFILIFQPSKFPFDLSILKYMEPEFVESYRLKKKKLRRKLKNSINQLESQISANDIEEAGFDQSFGMLTAQIVEDDRDSVIEDLKCLSYERNAQLNRGFSLSQKSISSLDENLYMRKNQSRGDKKLALPDSRDLQRKYNDHHSRVEDEIPENFEEPCHGCKCCSQSGMRPPAQAEKLNIKRMALGHPESLVNNHKLSKQSSLENSRKGAVLHTCDDLCSCENCRRVISQNDFDQASNDEDLFEELKLEQQSAPYNSRRQNGGRRYAFERDDYVWMNDQPESHFSKKMDITPYNQELSPPKSLNESLESSFEQNEHVSHLPQENYHNQVMEEEEEELDEIYHDQFLNNQIRDPHAQLRQQHHHKLIPQSQLYQTQRIINQLPPRSSIDLRDESYLPASNCPCHECSKSIPNQIIYVVSDTIGRCALPNCTNCQPTHYINLSHAPEVRMLQKQQVLKQIPGKRGNLSLGHPSQFEPDPRLKASQLIRNQHVGCNKSCCTSQHFDRARIVQESSIDSNIQEEDMEIERSNFTQIEKPKHYDPSVNPLYQSYLNKKKFERVSSNYQPAKQMQLKSKSQQYQAQGKMATRETALFSDDYIDDDVNEFFMQDYFSQNHSEITQKNLMKRSGSLHSHQQYYF